MPVCYHCDSEHDDEEFVGCSHCRFKNRKQAAIWRAANRQSIRDRANARNRIPEVNARTRERKKAWYDANVETAREYSRKYRREKKLK